MKPLRKYRNHQQFLRYPIYFYQYPLDLGTEVYVVEAPKYVIKRGRFAVIK